MARENLDYVEQQYQAFLANPDSVDSQWKLFFEGIEFARKTPASSLSQSELDVFRLIQAYRDYGFMKANLNPLADPTRVVPQLELNHYNMKPAQLEQSFQVGSLVGKPKSKLKEVIQFLEQTYCTTFSLQIAECLPHVRDWFVDEFEKSKAQFKLSKEEKMEVLQSLARTESLEKFIHTRYVGTKRFSVEGGDSLMPMLEALVLRGTSKGIEEIMIGMAHRGRINVLANFMGKALDLIFAEFDGHTKEMPDYDGDVKYHMGYSCVKKTPSGDCEVTLAFNPSHLEAVNPVVCGMARAKQRVRKDTATRKKVVPVLIHGDAAFAGQGVVSETLQMSLLPAHTVGGTIHIVIDNQVGFTADSAETRSTLYSSDIAKIIKAPVLHVNGDDVESCVQALDMAMRFRQKFGADVVINVICYRRYGHNEGDEPAFTQPLMYQKIKDHPTAYTLYSQQLVKEGLIDQQYADTFFQEKINNLQKILESVRKSPPEGKPLTFEGLWSGLRKGKREDFDVSTPSGVPLATLQKVGRALTSLPANFKAHAKIEKLLEGRRIMMAEGGKLDWGMAELLAYGSLIAEGTSVRLAGQDCVRGTFTHRHAYFHDIVTNEVYNPLATLNPDQEFVVYNSLLSEFACLGFEYGNSISDPTFLTIWEAQFGDFANGAQIIIDQFISSGEAKWNRMAGLTLLLPHGYEGQGPEHSSARLERFLQLCAQDNIQVIYPTLPSQIFHALRRQNRRDFRKPLVVMSPKSLLRNPKVVSPIQDLVEGGFQEVIDDPSAKKDQVQKLVFCTGKIYFDLEAAREEKKDTSVALIRIEQLYPFPEVQLMKVLLQYPNAKTAVWAQEEPRNMGAYYFIRDRIVETFIKAGRNISGIEYAGRTPRASPATGSPKTHQKEQTAILQSVF